MATFIAIKDDISLYEMTAYKWIESSSNDRTFVRKQGRNLIFLGEDTLKMFVIAMFPSSLVYRMEEK